MNILLSILSFQIPNSSTVNAPIDFDFENWQCARHQTTPSSSSSSNQTPPSSSPPPTQPSLTTIPPLTIPPPPTRLQWCCLHRLDNATSINEHHLSASTLPWAASLDNVFGNTIFIDDASWRHLQRRCLRRLRFLTPHPAIPPPATTHPVILPSGAHQHSLFWWRLRLNWRRLLRPRTPQPPTPSTSMTRSSAPDQNTQQSNWKPPILNSNTALNATTRRRQVAFWSLEIWCAAVLTVFRWAMGHKRNESNAKDIASAMEPNTANLNPKAKASLKMQSKWIFILPLLRRLPIGFECNNRRSQPRRKGKRRDVVEMIGGAKMVFTLFTLWTPV